MSDENKMGFWEFLHLNKTLKIMLASLICVVIFSLIYFITTGYKIETPYGTITPPQKESNTKQKVAKKDTVWKTKIVKEVKPITRIIHERENKLKDTSEILKSNVSTSPIVNVTSNNQTGGITANQVNIGKIKKNRFLTIGDKNYLLRFLTDKNEPITISFLVNDNEGYEYAKQFYDFLIENNYKKVNTYITPFMTSKPLIGQYVFRDKNNEVQIKIGAAKEE
jgi:hypothetical protein